MSSFPRGAQASLGGPHVHGANAVDGRDAHAVPASELTALYERVCGGAPGFLLARAASPDAARAVSAYVLRLASTAGSVALSASARPGAPLWHEVMMKLSPHDRDGHGAASHEPAAAAQQLVAAARGRRVMVVSPVPLARSWDAAVALELAAKSHTFLVVVVAAASEGQTADSGLDAALRAESFDIPAKLCGPERESWWAVLAESAAEELAGLELSELESWWTTARARSQPSTSSSPPRDLTGPEASLVTALTLAGRPWRVTELMALGSSPDTARVLVREGVLHESVG
ncbi:MAG: hypothetical protein ACLQVI_05840, partial [Polyangiaceae bacterium]